MHVCAQTRVNLMIVHMHNYRRGYLLIVHHLCIRFAWPGKVQIKITEFSMNLNFSYIGKE